jgi:hypothetical protein
MRRTRTNFPPFAAIAAKTGPLPVRVASTLPLDYPNGTFVAEKPEKRFPSGQDSKQVQEHGGGGSRRSRTPTLNTQTA